MKLMTAFAASLAMLVLATTCEAQVRIPESCAAYRRHLTSEAYRVMGQNAPIAVLAAQIQQESGCRANALSPVGAMGLTQFMPATARDMGVRFPAELGAVDPLNPYWAITAQVRYLATLQAGRYARKGATECDRWAFSLASYNGGEGWLARDQSICRAKPRDLANCYACDERRWFGHVEKSPDTRRSPANVRENRGYPSRILIRIAPAYVTAGWGRSVDCEVVP